MHKSENISANTTPFEGIYIGVVEDNVDPDKAGKCRVRILGIHSENKEASSTDGIPVSELPWAVPALPIFEGSNSGKGMFSVPLHGSHVAVFFKGADHNHPVYFATIASIPKTAPNKQIGFNDPDGVYPNKLNQPDWAGDARETNETKDLKDGTRETNISQISGTWSEPASSAATEYPHNMVLETKGGIVMEFDSTTGAIRFNVYHPSGAYIEISNDGQLVVKSAGNSYEINLADKHMLVKGDLKQKIEGNVDMKVDGVAKIKATRIDLN
jgi:hypothetical protein